MQTQLRTTLKGLLLRYRRMLVTTVSVISVLIPMTAQADTVRVDLYFDRLIPFTGLLYVPEADPAPISASVDQIGKRFTKRIIAGSPNGDFTFMNSDEFEHNIFADEPNNNAIFDVGLMQPGDTTSMRIEWNRDTLVRIGCKIHPRMRAYLANISTDKFTSFERARGTREYQLELADVPANAKSVTLLLAGFDTMRLQLAVGEKRDITLTRDGLPAATGSVSRR